MFALLVIGVIVGATSAASAQAGPVRAMVRLLADLPAANRGCAVAVTYELVEVRVVASTDALLAVSDVGTIGVPCAARIRRGACLEVTMLRDAAERFGGGAQVINLGAWRRRRCRAPLVPPGPDEGGLMEIRPRSPPRPIDPGVRLDGELRHSRPGIIRCLGFSDADWRARLTLSARGSVAEVRITPSEPLEVVHCLRAILVRWRFSPGTDGATWEFSLTGPPNIRERLPDDTER
jgi:hypothetical protein